MFLFLVYLFVFATFCFKFTNFLQIKSKGSCLSCSRYFSGPRSMLIWSYNIAILIHCEPLRYSMLLICSSIKYHCFKHQRIKFSIITLNIFFFMKINEMYDLVFLLARIWFQTQKELTLWNVWCVLLTWLLLFFSIRTCLLQMLLCIFNFW